MFYCYNYVTYSIYIIAYDCACETDGLSTAILIKIIAILRPFYLYISIILHSLLIFSREKPL